MEDKETKESTRAMASRLERLVMWFFPKKKEVKKTVPDWKTKALEECKAFRSKGDIFVYMGIEMMVTDHGTFQFLPYMGVWITPDIHADYVNKHGEVKHVVFGYDELETLRRQNTT